MEIVLPDLGENIEGGDVLSIMAAEGKAIQSEDPVIEIETDKATLEVPSPGDGVIEKILIKKGDFIKVGQVIAVLADNGSGSASSETAAASAPAPSAPAPEAPAAAPEAPAATVTAVASPPAPAEGSVSKTVVLPEMGEGIESGTVLNVLVEAGQQIEADSSLIEIETDKATLEVPSPDGGTVEEVVVKAGQDLKVGEPILTLKTTGSAAPQSAPATAPAAPAPSAPAAPAAKAPEAPTATQKSAPAPATAFKEPYKKKKLVPAAPSVRRFAFEIGIEITEVPGTGPNGRISIDDVKAYSKKLNSDRREAFSAGGPVQKPLPDFKKFGPIEKIDMNKIREITATHLSHSWQTIPHVTQFDKADITDLENVRQRYKKQVEAKGGKLTITAILVKVITTALKEFPQFNSSVDLENKQVIQKGYYNVGLAVDTPNGLVVPVIKDADKKNITELALEITGISKKARDRKITPDQLQGGTFTITNLGGIGGTAFTPIVNWPEVAILGISKSQMEPVYKDGEFVPRLMMPLSLSYDHKVIDGADGARFLNYLVNALQDPFVMALEG